MQVETKGSIRVSIIMTNTPTSITVVPKGTIIATVRSMGSIVATVET